MGKVKKFAALREALEREGYAPDGYWRGDHPKCPHCGHVCNLHDNEWYDLCDEGEHEVECPSCDKAFTVSTSVSYSFSTDEQDGLDDDEDATPQTPAGADHA